VCHSDYYKSTTAFVSVVYREVTPTDLTVSDPNTLNSRPFFFNFLLLKIVGTGTPVAVVVCVSKPGHSLASIPITISVN